MSIRLFLHVCFWSLLTVSVGRASPTLVTSAGTILGVDGVVVGSATYNPRFVDGTCAAV